MIDQASRGFYCNGRGTARRGAVNVVQVCGGGGFVGAGVEWADEETPCADALPAAAAPSCKCGNYTEGCRESVPLQLILTCLISNFDQQF